MPENGQLQTIRQAAAFLGVHPKTLYNWVLAHQITHVRIGAGRNIRFRRSDLEAYLDQRSIPERT